MEKMEQMLRDDGLLKGHSLYDVENVSTVHHVNQALKAHKLFHRDKDYIVRNGEIVIIDEFTGRMMPGRRYSEGLHQALEAKERQPVQPENQTLASITFQNYFRMYEKLAGMTGTAMTEADEFIDIYNLEVLEVPTNMPMIRVDEDANAVLPEALAQKRKNQEGWINLDPEVKCFLPGVPRVTSVKIFFSASLLAISSPMRKSDWTKPSASTSRARTFSSHGAISATSCLFAITAGNRSGSSVCLFKSRSRAPRAACQLGVRSARPASNPKLMLFA